MKILIADDDATSRRVLRAALVSLGHEVVEVADGVSAIAALAEPEAPSLAILDWMMPKLDGLAVCRTLRENPGRYVYVILLTSRDQPGDMVEALDGGADDFLTKPLNIGELRARLRSGERVVTLQDDLLRTQDILKHQAEHDPLTGLWNRRRIIDQLGKELSRNRREPGSSLAIAMADVDHFKRINDTYGHVVGDTVLRTLGQRVLSMLRVSDALGRYGGEEFLMVLPQADINGGREVAERVRAALANQPLIENLPALQVTVSVGVACSTPGRDSAALVEAADHALYQAKANGRNRVEIGVRRSWISRL